MKVQISKKMLKNHIEAEQCPALLGFFNNFFLNDIPYFCRQDYKI